MKSQNCATEQKTAEVQAGYDLIADEYARHIYDELRHKPLDRELLNQFAERVRNKGLVCDFGCGPGQVARYLHDHGISACGLDLSPGMLEQARLLNPGIEFLHGNMLALPVEDETWAGIAAFYAIVHFPPSDLLPAFQEMHRALQPEGWLLIAFHIGDQIEHVDEQWGRSVSLDFYFFQPEHVRANLSEAGFEVEEVIERGPYAPEVEYQSRRAYIFARKPLTTKDTKER